VTLDQKDNMKYIRLCLKHLTINIFLTKTEHLNIKMSNNKV